MTETQATIIIVLTSLSFLTSAACLTGMVLGAKKVTAQVEQVTVKAEAYKKKVTTFLHDLEAI